MINHTGEAKMTEKVCVNCKYSVHANLRDQLICAESDMLFAVDDDETCDKYERSVKHDD